MRIVEMVGDSHAGGWMDTILSGFKARGHDISLIVPDAGPLAERAKAQGIPTHFRPFPRRFRNLKEINAYTADIARWLRSWKADVAHMHLFPGAFWGRLAAWRAGIPVRATQWPGPAPLEYPLIRRIDLATAWMDTALIGGCEWVARHYRHFRMTRKKAFCVHYPFNMSPFDPTLCGDSIRKEFGISPDELVISLIAYMYPPLSVRDSRRAPHLGGGGIKGHEVLLRAAPLVLTKLPHARFLIVGDGLRPDQRGSYPDILKRMADTLGLGNRVVFTGFRRDVAAILAAADIPVVPSLTENLGGAVEPLLMEKPVVASRVGGLPDVVEDGKTGFLVPPGDPRALSDAIVALAAMSADRRREWGRIGRQRTLELCSPDRCLADLEAIFSRQLERRRGL